MILRHATPRSNLASIRMDGLLTAKSKGKLPAVWLHAPALTSWAVIHTVKRHGGAVEDVVILEVRVPRPWLRKSQKGLWYCPRDIGAGRVVGLIEFSEVAGPCAEGGVA
jgi:hypothetical protein